MKARLFLLLVAFLVCGTAHAKLHRGSATGGGASLLTNIQLANATGSLIAANSITPISGHAFKKGDLPNGCSGSAPVFKIHADSTVVPFSENTNPICWNDGSLKWASFMWRDPESIAAATTYTIQASGNSYTTSTGQISLTLNTTATFNIGEMTLSSLTGTGAFASLNGTWKVISVTGSVVVLQGPGQSLSPGSATITGGTATQPTYIQVDVYSGGTTPAASARALSDFALSSLDLNQQVVGLDSQLSGTWTSDLNQGIGANGADYKYMDGAAGAVWRVRAAFRQSSANHGQLEGWWYVQSLQNSGGGLYGLRWLVNTAAPYYDVVSPAANFWSFSSIGDYNGVSLVKDPWTGHEGSFSFNWSSGTNFTTSGFPWEQGNLLRLSGGSLPTGLSTGTSYYMGSSSQNYDGINFFIATSSQGVIQGDTLITPTGSACSPCGTAISYPYITQFGGIYDAQSNGRYNYIQGGGSIASDPVIQVVINNTYLRSTQLIPPFNFSGNVGSSNSQRVYTFYPMTSGPVGRDFGGTGESCNIGPFNCWEGMYLFNQTSIDEQTLRIMGLAGGTVPFNFRNVATHNLPSVNNGSYTNMTAVSAYTLGWACGTNQFGFTLPANNQVFTEGWLECQTDHIPEMAMVPFLITGEPQYMDEVENFGELATISRNNTNMSGAVNGSVMAIGCDTVLDCTGGAANRHMTVNGTTYYSADLFGLAGLRGDAWAIRNVAAAAMASKADPSCAGCSQYFTDMVASTQNAFIAYTGLFSGAGYTYAFNNGIYAEGGVAPWAEGYFINGLNLAYNWTENSNIGTNINYLNKWFAHVNNTYGTSWVGGFQTSLRTDSATIYAPYAGSDANVLFGALIADTTSGNPTIAFSSFQTGYTLTNGDYFSIDSNNTIGGVTVGTTYCIKNVSGNNAQIFLATTAPPATCVSTGSAITPSTNSHSFVYYWGPSLQPPNAASNPDAADSYSANLLGAFEFSKALGLTIDATTLSNMKSLMSGQTDFSTLYLNNPKYFYQDHY